MADNSETQPTRTLIPATGHKPADLLKQMQDMRAEDADWQGGRTWSMVYYIGAEHHDFLKQAHNLFFAENGLNPMAFKSLKQMEAEVVQMSAGMLNGGRDTVGTMTSGGTESILLAVKAARDRARKTRPWILRPELVAPKTIHVAFDKACHYFGVKPRYVDVGPDFRADVDAMRKAIGRNTVLVAASAPQYPQGVIDPIAELGEICADKGVPFHVDACFGGFILPWIERLGHELPVFDFRVPGVTSMSADVHKFGYAAKGASVILYRDMSYLKHQFFVSTDWPGGIYASPSMPGTRPGGPIAAAWAALKSVGEDGYMAHAREAVAAAQELRDGVAAIAGLTVLGAAHSTVVAIAADDPAVDVYAVADVMGEQGWNIDRQQNPACLHCTVNGHNRPQMPTFLSDLADATAHVRAHPELASEGNAAMYGMMAKVPVRGLVKLSVQKVMESMYGPEGSVPDLSQLGAGEDDGFVLQFIHKYGDQAMDMLDRVNGYRARIGGRLRRK
ncbi:MAG: aspartate aminotransferase family protein [Myxococcales bacterium]|nr:aspartate aminotransferase family protein [Myxococcales bacterium]